MPAVKYVIHIGIDPLTGHTAASVTEMWIDDDGLPIHEQTFTDRETVIRLMKTFVEKLEASHDC